MKTVAIHVIEPKLCLVRTTVARFTEEVVLVNLL